MKKTILIIGGMGPQASLLLHKKIIEKSVKLGAKHGEDFPSILHFSIPVPEFLDTKNTRQLALHTIKESLY